MVRTHNVLQQKEERSAETEEVPGADLAASEDSEPYVEIRPTDSGVSAATAAEHFRRLHHLRSEDDGGWLARLLGAVTPDDPPPTIEFVLTSTGKGPTSVRYFVGLPDEAARDMFESLEHVLRGLFPNDYEIRQVDSARSPVNALLSDGQSEDDLASDIDDVAVTGIEYYGRADHRGDWQTELTPFEAFQSGPQSRLPLTAVVDAMATHDEPMVFQALVRRKPDWSRHLEAYSVDLLNGQARLRDQLLAEFLPSVDEPDETSIRPSDRDRIESLEERDARCSFDVNARAIVHSESDEPVEAGSARPAASKLETAFGAVGNDFYDVDARIRTGDDGRAVLEDILDRRFHEPYYERARNLVPFTTNWSRGIVADRTEVGSFCLLGGETLTVEGDRAVAPTPGERTTVPRPPDEQLARYRGAGFPIGKPLTGNRQEGTEPVTIPPALQTLHLGLVGSTGSGKTTALANAILRNQAATDGADILLSPMGDGLATEYLRAHYADQGHLDDVYYFDCTEWLPAISFFDIRDELAAGIPRTTAVENRVDHYIEILEAVNGEEQFNRAVRSPDVIRYLVKAMFDPATGADAFGHADLLDAAQTMASQQSPPRVGDDSLQRLLNGVTATSKRSFDEIMAGAMNRMEAIPADRRLGLLFDNAPDDDDTRFDLADVLDDDVVVVVDTSGLRAAAQRVVSLLVVSNLWTALRRRDERNPDREHPLVNLYVEEAASLAVSDLLGDLLAKGRGYGCSVTLSMQFPGQFRHDDPATYEEVLNNVGTIVAGSVRNDRRFAERLATADMDAEAVGNRLRALGRGEWLVDLPAAFGEAAPRPFQVTSLPLPPGAPSGPDPLSPGSEAAFEAERTALAERSKYTVGIPIPEPTTEAGSVDDVTPTPTNIESALPHTERLPKPVRYDEDRHALRCSHCDGRHDPDHAGMKRAIACCSSIDQVSRESVPICEVNLKLSPEECASAEYTTRQLLFLQAVYNAQQFRYEPLAYDLMRDSMTILREYLGIEQDAVDELVDDGLLWHDTDYPHRLYTVTPDGRDLIGERYREGLDFGDGLGDMHESTEHTMAVELARRYLEAEYADDAESPVTTVRAYHDVEDRERLDVAGLDDEGEVVVAVEVERLNGRETQAVPADYDKLAASDAEEAIWLVMSEADAHEVLGILNDPPDGVPRVEKTYSESTRSQYFTIDAEGLTDIFIVDHLREALEIE